MDICSGPVLQDIQVAAMTNMINDINELLLFMDLQSSQKPQTGLCPSTTFTTASVTSRKHMTDEESIFSLNFHACSKEQSKEQRNCQQVNFQQAQNYYCATTQHNNNLPSNSKLDFGHHRYLFAEISSTFFRRQNRPDPALYIRKDGPVGPILSYITFYRSSS